MAQAAPAARAGLSARLIARLRAHWAAALASALLALTLLPLLALGQDSYVTIHDNLDSIVVSRAVAARDGHVFRPAGDEVIPQIMNGLPRAFLASSFNLIFALFALLPPFTAYAANHVVVHVAAFWGMARFSRCWLGPLAAGAAPGRPDPAGRHDWIHWGVGLAFALLPFYSMYGLTVAGLPLLAHVFLRILRGEARLPHYLFLAVFPFYANFLLNGPFVAAGLGILAAVYAARTRRFAARPWLALAGFTLLWGLTEFDLIRTMLLGGGEPSHRAAWNLAYQHYPLAQAARSAAELFLAGQYHAASHHQPALLAGLLLVALALTRRTADARLAPAARWLLLLAGVQLAVAALAGFFFWDGLLPLKARLGGLSSFNAARVLWLAPFIWYVFLALALLRLMAEPRLPRAHRAVLAAGVLVVQAALNLAYNPDFGHYAARFVRLPGFRDEGITYRQFFAERQFAAVRDAIGRPQAGYRVVSLGIHPSIAQYNGFYTLDSYQTSYPLSYKQAFRAVIAPELALSPSWQAYFDDWGSRAYIFSRELPDALSTKQQGRVVRHLAIDTRALAALGGRYVLSAVEIANHAELRLAARGVFEDPQSAWTIYLYEVELDASP